MLRFFARSIGFWLVAAALVAAIVDGAKSIGASRLVATPLSETWMTVAGLIGWTSSENGAPLDLIWPFDLLVAWLLAAPAILVFAVPGVVLLIAGAKRRRFSINREFAA